MHNMTQTICVFLLFDAEASWFSISKLGLLTIRWHNATHKYLFLYPQGDGSCLRKPKKDKHHH